MAMLVISTSLNPQSRSRVLAREAVRCLRARSGEATLLDIEPIKLPVCDGGGAYAHPAVAGLAEQIRAAEGVLLAFSVYNYDAGASCKNLIELTGKAWTGKVVGLACAAGGASAYMAPLQIANALMVDFRCIVLPRYVYAAGDAVNGEAIVAEEITRRLDELCGELMRVGRALRA